MKKFFKHLHLINKHRFYVLIHCAKCGIFFRGLVHDLSKYSPVEFWESVKYFNGEHSPIEDCRKENGYSMAWLNHKGRNRHHFEYWYDHYCNTQPIIPYKYLIECICDRISASKIYFGKNFEKQSVLNYWLDGDYKLNHINPKVKEFITKVFTDYTQRPEKEILNKKYLKQTYENICLK